MIGTNLTHTDFEGCSLRGAGIIARYHEGSIRKRVQKDLRTMRLNGVETIRTIVWHMSDASGQDWGVISSAGGRLTPQAKQNLADFVADVRQSRFRRLTLAFGPLYANSPSRPNYQPDKLQENWRFITGVRAVVKNLGPADTHFDLLNEGAPSDYQHDDIRRQVENYVAKMYARYVRTFGARDVLISSIGAPSATDRGQRLLNLVTILRSTGYPLPLWFDVHMNYRAQEVMHALRTADQELGEAGLSQPLIVAETSYESRGAADAISLFRRESRRHIDEVVQWYAKPGGCPVEPPYTVGAFRSALDERRTGGNR
jgi:hypothetical protein